MSGKGTSIWEIGSQKPNTVFASNVGFPEKMKLHNCHIYAKDLGLSHAVFLAVSSVFVSYYETSLDQG